MSSEMSSEFAMLLKQVRAGSETAFVALGLEPGARHLLTLMDRRAAEAFVSPRAHNTRAAGIEMPNVAASDAAPGPVSERIHCNVYHCDIVKRMGRL